jgi:hypothetical protein
MKDTKLLNMTSPILCNDLRYRNTLSKRSTRSARKMRNARTDLRPQVKVQEQVC